MRFGRLALGISDKPKPFEAPVSRSVITLSCPQLHTAQRAGGGHEIRRTKTQGSLQSIHAKVLLQLKIGNNRQVIRKQYAGAQGQATMQEKREEEPGKHTSQLVTSRI